MDTNMKNELCSFSTSLVRDLNARIERAFSNNIAGLGDLQSYLEKEAFTLLAFAAIDLKAIDLSKEQFFAIAEKAWNVRL